MNSCIVLILKTVHVLTLKQTLTWAVLFYCRRQTVAAYNWGIFTQTFRSGSANVLSTLATLIQNLFSRTVSIG